MRDEKREKREKKKSHTPKAKWWDVGGSKACLFGDKAFMKKYSRLRGRKIKCSRSRTNAIAEAIRVFEKMKQEVA